MNTIKFLLSFFFILSSYLCFANEELKKPILSPWAEKLNPEKPYQDYPRPQMERQQWLNLNGKWEFDILPLDNNSPRKYRDTIVVPFPVESYLSGVQKRVTKEQALHYRKKFKYAKPKSNQKVYLHFAAVDWKTEVWVNGQYQGSHTGGFDPFKFEISKALKKSGKQTIQVKVWDPSNEGDQPVGKQRIKNKGIFYTPVSGIWQTVWLETVSNSHISQLKITPNIDQELVYIKSFVENSTEEHHLELKISKNGKTILATNILPNIEEPIKIPSPQLWSPDSPHLYDISLKLSHNGDELDSVKSYFGMRKISVDRDEFGNERIFLNNKAFFSYGLLDQGWWPGGLYSAPSDAGLKYDIEISKKAGFNTIRKHVKIEPARWYYWADKIGMLVWQDMVPPAGGVKVHERKIPNRSKSLMDKFRKESAALVEHFYHFPSIGIWVPYNEGWGQGKNTNDILHWIKQLDPSRLIDGPSGWLDLGVGDLRDMHFYSWGNRVPNEKGRVPVLGEYGGFTLEIENHVWDISTRFGYQKSKDIKQYNQDYIRLMEYTRELVNKGLGAAIYTQTTDVEGEVNGILTYDRKVLKLDIPTILPATLKLYEKPDELRYIVESADVSRNTKWKYSFNKPADNSWLKSNFNDQQWQTGKGLFGYVRNHSHLSVIPWGGDKGDHVWLRKSFNLKQIPKGKLWLNLNNNVKGDLYLNGKKLISLSPENYKKNHQMLDFDKALKKKLKKGINVFSVYLNGENATVHKWSKKVQRAFDVGIIETK